MSCPLGVWTQGNWARKRAVRGPLAVANVTLANHKRPRSLVLSWPGGIQTRLGLKQCLGNQLESHGGGSGARSRLSRYPVAGWCACMNPHTPPRRNRTDNRIGGCLTGGPAIGRLPVDLVGRGDQDHYRSARDAFENLARR